MWRDVLALLGSLGSLLWYCLMRPNRYSWMREEGVSVLPIDDTQMIRTVIFALAVVVTSGWFVARIWRQYRWIAIVYAVVVIAVLVGC